MRKRRIVVLLLVGVVWAVREQFQNHLTVENRSGQPIALLQVTIGGETTVFRDVPAGAETTSTFHIWSDDHFTVEGRLADGTKVEGDFGYVTNGMSGERARVVVLPGGQIEFQQTNRIGPY